MATADSKLAITGKPVWFITGCSTGIGRELAKHVLECGYRAVVTARDLNDITEQWRAHGAIKCAPSPADNPVTRFARHT